MSRRRNPDLPNMLMEMLESILKVVPAWTSIPTAAVGFVLIVWWWSVKVTDPSLKILGMGLGAVFAMICLAAGFKGWQSQRERRRFLAQQIGLEWVNQLSWRAFEQHVAEVYRQKGYRVQELGGGGADGGIDLKLAKDGKTTVVQCKYWKTWKVGVRPVRELFGVMTAEKAAAAIFIASGRYTSEAQRFAEDKPMQLIGQNEFIELARQFQRELKNEPAPGAPVKDFSEELSSVPPPRCPKCRHPMVLRRAKAGPLAGKQFWGCASFPKCRGTLDVIVPKQFGS